MRIITAAATTALTMSIPISEAIWTLFSLCLYATNVTYLTLKRINENYSVYRGAFPADYATLQRVWIVAAAASVAVAYAAYIIAGGWQSADVSMIALYVSIEFVRGCWAVLLFRFGSAGWSLLLVALALLLRIYLSTLYGLLQPVLAVSYAPLLLLSVVESVQSVWTLRRYNQLKDSDVQNFLRSMDVQLPTTEEDDDHQPPQDIT